MRTLDHYATNYLEHVKVMIIAPAQVVEDANVEYCISSGYVKIQIGAERTLITHISNVVIEVT